MRRHTGGGGHSSDACIFVESGFSESWDIRTQGRPARLHNSVSSQLSSTRGILHSNLPTHHTLGHPAPHLTHLTGAVRRLALLGTLGL